jgi:hypothetical protein
MALMALAPAAASAATFAGTWSVAGTIGNPVVAKATPVCKLAQSGSKLAGTCRGPNGAGAAAGAVSGRAITLTWRVVATNAIGSSGIITYKGVLGNDGVIRGTWTFSTARGLVGTFTAIRA